MSVLNNLLSFFRTVLAVVVGLCIFSGIGVLFLIAIVGIAVSSLPNIENKDASYAETHIRDQSVLHLKLNTLSEADQALEDEESISAVIQASMNPEQGLISRIPPGVLGIAYAVRKAAEDPKIVGISMELDNLRAGFAQLKELNDAIRVFKNSGKFIYAYAEHLNEPTFYLSAFADTLVLNSYADVEFNGFTIQLSFFKGTLDLIGLNPRVFRVGKYKSAVEMFTEKRMSDASRQQYSELLNGLYEQYLQDLARTRSVDADSLRSLADRLAVVDAKDAKKYAFATQLGYKQDYDKLLRKRLQLKKKEKIRLVSAQKYKRSLPEKSQSKDILRVIIAEGEIYNNDELYSEGISSGNLIPLIEQATKHKDVKAIVLRINSPGGSAYSSDKIWHALREAAKKKPVIASMSNVAASGGYYLAMACDKIVAYPNTVTGSIGVFSILLEYKEVQEKLGISQDKLKTSPYADVSVLGETVTKAQARLMQRGVDRVYQDFIEKAAQGRKLTPEEIHEVAQGRVWIGKDALAQRLVDVTGNFEEALQLAAEASHLDEYRVQYAQTAQHPIQILERLLQKMQIPQSWLQLLPHQLHEAAKEIQKQELIDNPLSIKYIQARLRYQLDIR